MDERDDLATAQDEARRRVAAITADQWHAPTPCTDWDVNDLVVHLIETSQMAALLLGGGPAQAAAALFGREHGSDLAAELDHALREELAGFGAPGALAATVHHPGAGDIPGAMLLRFRTSDYLLHSWDIARAIGADETLPEDLVAATWQGMQPLAPVIGTVGAFGTGPSGDVGEGEPLQQRLLDLTGRRP